MDEGKGEITGKAGGGQGVSAPPADPHKGLGNTLHDSFFDIESLPKSVRRRVNALKQLQVQVANIEAKFYQEVHELERKYGAQYQPLNDKRWNIVAGEVEPTDEESRWQIGADDEGLGKDLKEKVMIQKTQDGEGKKANEEATTTQDPKGIPDFWLTAFKNVDMISDLVQIHDEPILKHLQDVRVAFSEPDQPMSFTLEFHFEPNSFFKNEVLTKVYKLKAEPDKEDPFSFEGPEIVHCEGCQIDWHKGKDVTMKTIKKKQKHKGRGTVRTITKQVPNDSFFNFFNPIRVSTEGELDEDSEYTLATDFGIGHFFRERLIPRAVLYFTGEAMEDDESFEEEELDEEVEEDDDGEDDDDDEGGFDTKKDVPQPAECKQQ